MITAWLGTRQAAAELKEACALQDLGVYSAAVCLLWTAVRHHWFLLVRQLLTPASQLLEKLFQTT